MSTRGNAISTENPRGSASPSRSSSSSAGRSETYKRRASSTGRFFLVDSLAPVDLQSTTRTLNKEQHCCQNIISVTSKEVGLAVISLGLRHAMMWRPALP